MSNKRLMLYFIHHRQQYHQNVACDTTSNIFWWDKFFSNSVNITFPLCVSFFFQTLFLLFFNSISLSFDLFEFSVHLLYLLCHLPSIFCFRDFFFFLLFWMLWILVTVNKLKYTASHGPHASHIPCWKTLITQFFLVCPMK